MRGHSGSLTSRTARLTATKPVGIFLQPSDGTLDLLQKQKDKEHPSEELAARHMRFATKTKMKRLELKLGDKSGDNPSGEICKEGHRWGDKAAAAAVEQNADQPPTH